MFNSLSYFNILDKERTKSLIMDFKSRVTHSIIANQIALNHNEALKHTPYYKQELKRGINLLLPHLIKAEEDYDHFFKELENNTTEIYDIYEEYLQAVASVPVHLCKDITLIIEAYNKDPKAIEGIVKKILK
jgi:hypothetical protein